MVDFARYKLRRVEDAPISDARGRKIREGIPIGIIHLLVGIDAIVPDVMLESVEGNVVYVAVVPDAEEIQIVSRVVALVGFTY